MTKNTYKPPEQGTGGQWFDSLFLLALVYITLFAPLVLGLTGGGTTTKTIDNPTWQALGQNATMAAQWEKLGYSPKTAADMITTRFDYAINPWALIATAIVIIGYFVFLVRFSEKEYRQVISERFDDSK